MNGSDYGRTGFELYEGSTKGEKDGFEAVALLSEPPISGKSGCVWDVRLESFWVTTVTETNFISEGISKFLLSTRGSNAL